MSLQCSLVQVIIQGSICQSVSVPNDQRGNNCKVVREVSACIKIQEPLVPFFLALHLRFIGVGAYLHSTLSFDPRL